MQDTRQKKRETLGKSKAAFLSIKNHFEIGGGGGGGVVFKEKSERI